MTELKTLKDLNRLDENKDVVVDTIKLKAEAVKWVKELKIKYYNWSPELFFEFMNFFNLTEEDLK